MYEPHAAMMDFIFNDVGGGTARAEGDILKIAASNQLLAHDVG